MTDLRLEVGPPSCPRARTGYDAYLRLDELLALQVPLGEDVPDSDELQFIVVHQSTELWFKLVLHELDAAGWLLDRDAPAEAAARLRRIDRVGDVLLAQLRVLESMTPWGFAQFRHLLGRASGAQSRQYWLVHANACGPASSDASHPPLWDRFVMAMARQHLPVDAASLVASLSTLHRRPHLRGLADVAEAMLQVDACLRAWRERHVSMIQRVIGDLPGTAGHTRPGVLGSGTELSRPDRRLFPQLWQARGLAFSTLTPEE